MFSDDEVSAQLRRYYASLATEDSLVEERLRRFAIGLAADAVVPRAEKRPRRWLRPAAAALSAVAILGGVAVLFGHGHKSSGGPGSNIPLLAMPTAIPAAHANADTGCLVTGGAPRALDSGALPTVSPDPSGATVIWIPGASGTQCRPVRTTLPAGVAQNLARHLNAAPSFASFGATHCPNDLGIAADVYFHFPGTAKTQLMVLPLTGCQSAYSPGFAARWFITMSDAAFVKQIPSGWVTLRHFP